MAWPRKRAECSNCGSNERRHAALGLCTLCYRLTSKRRIAEQWRLDNPLTLKEYPFLGSPGIDLRSFERFKRNVIGHYQNRLDYLKGRGKKLKGEVDGLDLEYAFDYLARLAGSRKRSMFHGLCGWFEMIFDPEQRRALLRIVDKIEKEVDRDINIASLLARRD